MPDTEAAMTGIGGLPAALTAPAALALPPKGRLAANVVHFVRLLRAAGVPAGPDRILTALEAVEIVGVGQREDLRAALAASLVSREEHRLLFDLAFDRFFRNPRVMERWIASMLPKVAGRRPPEAPPPLPARLDEAWRMPSAAVPSRAEEGAQTDAVLTFSAREVLRRKDFATMTGAEMHAVKAMLARLRLPLPERRVRRLEPARRGPRVDARTSLRRAAGAAGTLAPLAWQAQARRTPPLVVLCDISGSMERYARMLLHFLHAITNDRDRVHVLLFGTRLTNVTRQLKHRDVDVALAQVTARVADWAGGTRIGACLREFNRHWSRRLLGQNAVVLLITDGLDADAGEGLEHEIERLHASCTRLLWLNPLLRYAGFEARPAGIRAMRPHVDAFLPVHNLDSLTGLAQALEAGRAGRR